jgi:hypothetical protein
MEGGGKRLKVESKKFNIIHCLLCIAAHCIAAQGCDATKAWRMYKRWVQKNIIYLLFGEC